MRGRLEGQQHQRGLAGCRDRAAADSHRALAGIGSMEVELEVAKHRGRRECVGDVLAELRVGEVPSVVITLPIVSSETSWKLSRNNSLHQTTRNRRSMMSSGWPIAIRKRAA